jgi:hypothetical protein
MPDLLHRAGWQLTTVEDLTGAYERWYDALVQRMESKRARAASPAAGVPKAALADKNRVAANGAACG